MTGIVIELRFVEIRVYKSLTGTSKFFKYSTNRGWGQAFGSTHNEVDKVKSTTQNKS